MSASPGNPTSSLPVRSSWLALALTGFLQAGQTLPVFLSDNHAETFGWISRNFDPDGRHQLVLVDAHSDASMAERSEEIREGLRRVPSPAARAAAVEEWRTAGRIQAFNWIEPLMPRPLDHVLWLASPGLTGHERAAAHADACGLLDGRLEVEPRAAGSFAGRWTTVDLRRFRSWKPGPQPVILSIDLDFFTGMEPGKREEMFEMIWEQAMGWPHLAGVAFSVSRPWLADDGEADALVTLACGAVARTRGAVLEIDASVDDRPDGSGKAASASAAVPRWDAANASATLRGGWRALGDRLRITDRKRNLDFPGGDALPSIHAATGEADYDGVWRFPLHEAPALRVVPPPDATGRVRWFALEPAQAAYDLVPETGLGKAFANSPGRWIYERRRSLGITADLALAAEKWGPTTAGRVRLAAECETPGGWIPVPPIELRLVRGTGFRAALSECFRMPYVFGIGGVAEDGLTGVEAGWGSDCANLLIHAWRRNGIPLAWGDPGRLRGQLATRMEHVTLKDAASITPEDIERGMAIDFGKHVAALWEDRPPLGRLSGTDLVAHHLGGFPEIVELSSLTRSRPVFSLRVPREPADGPVR